MPRLTPGDLLNSPGDLLGPRKGIFPYGFRVDSSDTRITLDRHLRRSLVERTGKVPATGTPLMS